MSKGYRVVWRKVFFEDGTTFEGDTQYHNGGIYTVSEDGKLWTWFPPHKVDIVIRRNP